MTFIDELKVRREQATERFTRQRDQWISQLPAGIQGKLQDSRPLRWGATSGVVAATIMLGVSIILLPLAVDGVTPFRDVFNAVRSTIFLMVVMGLNYGLLGYLVGRRARVEPAGPIVRRVVIASLLGLVIPLVGGILPFIAIYWKGFGDRVRRGRSLSPAEGLQRHLLESEQQVLAERGQAEQLPKLQIGGVQLPNYLENLGFFFFGSPGSGKSQSIKRLLQLLKRRSDFRAIVLDRNGELMESFFDAERDLIFNPYDARSVGWSHVNEGLRPETVAAPLVPLQSTTDPFWDKAGRNLLSDIYSRTRANSEVWEVLTTYSFEELREFLKGTQSSDYFASEKTGAAVKATAINQLRFYEDLPEGDFSFSGWGRSDDARWLWLPLFREDAERLQPLHTMAFELIIRGLLTEENRDVQTAVVIDELAALHKLDSLTALLSEGRKFKATAVLGTQSTAQIDNTYGENDREIVLQGAATKLILNCRSPQTAEVAADIIGKQERIDVTESRTHEGFLGGSKTYTENIRETHIVMPSEIQALPELVGYLDIADGSPPARVEVQYRDYPKVNQRLVPTPK